MFEIHEIISGRLGGLLLFLIPSIILIRKFSPIFKLDIGIWIYFDEEKEKGNVMTEVSEKHD